MAFVATRKEETIFGNKRVIFGTFANDATSGTIATGLNKIDYVACTGATKLIPTKGSVAVTLAATSTDGFWMAFGSD